LKTGSFIDAGLFLAEISDQYPKQKQRIMPP